MQNLGDELLLFTVITLSVISGIAVYLQGRRENRIADGKIHLISEVFNALLAGVGVFFLGMWQSYPEPLICLVSIIAASNGVETIALITKAIKNKLGLNKGKE